LSIALVLVGVYQIGKKNQQESKVGEEPPKLLVDGLGDPFLFAIDGRESDIK
jgi:hypothetical protein